MPVINLTRDLVERVTSLAERATGHRPSPPTVWRWCKKGVKVGGGRVRLEAVKVSGQWHTTPAAWAAFIQTQTDAALARHDDSDAPAERSARTERRLQDAGLV